MQNQKPSRQTLFQAYGAQSSVIGALLALGVKSMYKGKHLRLPSRSSTVTKIREFILSELLRVIRQKGFKLPMLTLNVR